MLPQWDDTKLHASINVGGVGYWITDYSTCGGPDTRARKWEALVYYAVQNAGSPKQSLLVCRGCNTLEEAKAACCADMKKRGTELLLVCQRENGEPT